MAKNNNNNIPTTLAVQVRSTWTKANKFSLRLYCWRCRIVTHSRHLVFVMLRWCARRRDGCAARYAVTSSTFLTNPPQHNETIDVFYIKTFGYEVMYKFDWFVQDWCNFCCSSRDWSIWNVRTSRHMYVENKETQVLKDGNICPDFHNNTFCEGIPNYHSSTTWCKSERSKTATENFPGVLYSWD